MTGLPQHRAGGRIGIPATTEIGFIMQAVFQDRVIATSDQTVVVEGVTEQDAAWTYRHPSPFARRMKNRVAFWGSVTVVDSA